MPILPRLETTTGSRSVHGVTLRLIITMFLHAAASHMPSLLVSYLDCFISACALARSPWNPGVA